MLAVCSGGVVMRGILVWEISVRLPEKPNPEDAIARRSCRRWQLLDVVANAEP